MDLRSRLGSGRADVTDRRHGARHHHFAAPRHRPFRLLATCVALTLAATSCGNDDDPPADEAEEATATTAPVERTEVPSDEEPPGTEPAAVEPYLDQLLTRYDEVTSQIVGDPEIAADGEHELYADLRALLDPNSEMANAIVQSLVTQGEQGIAIEPYQDAPEPAKRTVDGAVETVSESEVRFPLCTRYSYRLITSSRIEVGDNHDRRSQGTAVRVDGHWRISRLEGNNDLVECEEVE